MYCDSHVVKICLEAAQILCSVYWMNGSEAPYKLSHKNHPVCVFTRTSSENFNWVCRHALALCKEYTARYGRTHKSEKVIDWCVKNTSALKFDKTEQTPFALAMPDIYKTKCPVESYRSYFKAEKVHLHKWKRNKPSWINTQHEPNTIHENGIHN